MTEPRPEHAHVSARPANTTPTSRPPHPRQKDGWKTNVLSSTNCPSTVALQQRCHSTSTSAQSPSWQPMPSPCLQRAATARQEKIQVPIAEQNFPSEHSFTFSSSSPPPSGPPGDRGALHCHWPAIATQPIGLVLFQVCCILPVVEEQSQTHWCQNSCITDQVDQPQCRGWWHSS
jgi:hypothetical protein